MLLHRHQEQDGLDRIALADRVNSERVLPPAVEYEPVIEAPTQGEFATADTDTSKRKRKSTND